MPDRHDKVIIDTNLWISFLIGLKASPAIRKILTDGTVIPLRLIEGGYVGYGALGWYFVRIPGEVFDAVYDACGGARVTDWTLGGK